MSNKYNLVTFAYRNWFAIWLTTEQEYLNVINKLSECNLPDYANFIIPLINDEEGVGIYFYAVEEILNNLYSIEISPSTYLDLTTKLGKIMGSIDISKLGENL